jgi:hypothetical protein
MTISGKKGQSMCSLAFLLLSAVDMCGMENRKSRSFCQKALTEPVSQLQSYRLCSRLVDHMDRRQSTMCNLIIDDFILLSLKVAPRFSYFPHWKSCRFPEKCLFEVLLLFSSNAACRLPMADIGETRVDQRKGGSPNWTRPKSPCHWLRVFRLEFHKRKPSPRRGTQEGGRDQASE